ncbi:hypothetical protein TSMG0084 [Halocynthia phage JM-2012]|uniref:hypothetical protein n=1 Tax=Halocynthia phage JM-2012 TaxID=1173297 RepID=UPI00025C6928|nr:hypothetical protein TSMG0084 [Halocynthia phage JM-2012]AFI55367.1 hypothetical protein TSMG0084 [Halocynthia phage JM-2012]
MIFPQTRRVATKNDIIEVAIPKHNEYYLNNLAIDDVERTLRVFQLMNNQLFAVSALVDERMILKQVLLKPKEFDTRIHTINAISDPLQHVYSIEGKYPEIRNIPVTNLTADKSSQHVNVHYLLRIGRNSKCSLSRCETNIRSTASIMGF